MLAAATAAAAAATSTLDSIRQRRVQIQQDVARLRLEDARLFQDERALRPAAATSSSAAPAADDNASAAAAAAASPSADIDPGAGLPWPASPSFWGEDKVALASYPRSGNSLLRRLLEALTGTSTGSDARPERPLVQQLVRMGFAGEGVMDGRVWLVKTHYPERAGRAKCQVSRAVVLVRNPFDALASNFHMLLTSSHTKSVAEEEFFSRFAPLWNDWLLEEVGMWAQFYAHWAACDVPSLVVRYEDLCQHRGREVARIAGFLYEPHLESAAVARAAVLTSLHALASRDQAELSLYVPRKGLEPVPVDPAQAVEAFGADPPERTRRPPLALDPAKPGYLRSLHLFSDDQYRFVLAAARSPLAEYGYWDSCLAARPAAAPDVVGFVDRPLGLCLERTPEGQVLLNARFGIRPRTPADPYARGFDIRWDARLQTLPSPHLAAGGEA
jgi:hypothetical protein